jgi:hypothetical protein
MLTCKVLASSVAKGSPNVWKKVLRMMFSERAAATKANILFDAGASNNFVSKLFAKQTGITVRPVEYFVCLADDKTPEVAGEALVYVQLGAFHKPVKCYVMDMLYKVDLILGEEFIDKYDCILQYGKGCIMIRKGKIYMTVNSLELLRNQLPVDDEKFDSFLSASHVKQVASKGARVFLAVIRPMELDFVPSVVASVATPSPDEPTSSVQPDQPAGPLGGEVPWIEMSWCLSFLKCFRILCRLVCPLNVQKGTIFLRSQVILRRLDLCTIYLRWNTKSWESRSPSF